MADRTVAIVEVQAEGHHPLYLRLVSQAFSEGGWHASYGLNGEPKTEGRLREAAGGWLAQTDQHILSTRAKPGKWRLTSAIGSWLATKQPELLFFNSFDLVASAWCRWAALGWQPPHGLQGRIAGFYLRPRFLESDARGLGNAWKRLGFHRLVTGGWFRRLLVLDEHLRQRVADDRWRDCFTWVPDPWEGDFAISAEEARRKWELPDDRQVLLHFGTGSPRKGLPMLVEALERLPAHARPFLLCCGRLGLAKEWKSRIARLEHARVHDRFLTETERVEVFRAVDVVALLYRGHYGSSGVLVNAAAAGRPVIATNGGLLGRRVRENRLGLVVEEGGLGLSEALERCAREGRRLAEQRDLESFAKSHSPTAFKRNLLGAFEEVEA